MAVNVDRVVIDSVHVGGTVVQAMATFKVEVHGEKSVVTGKLDAPGSVGSLKPSWVHWTKTLLEARMAKGNIIVSTMFAQ
jgi:hypothetical protein